MDAIKEAMIRDEDRNGPPVAAHTAGPWEINRGISDQFRFFICSPKGDAELGNWLVARTAWEIDARLIAAAPDMLAALKAAVKRADDNLSQYSFRDEGCAKDYAMCVAAIAKATGAP